MAKYDNIRISTDALEELEAQFSQLRTRLDQQRSAVRSILSGLDESSGAKVYVSMNTKLNVGTRLAGSSAKNLLDDISRALDACGDESNRLRKAVDLVNDKFTRNENRIVKAFSSIGEGAESGYGKGVSGSSSGASSSGGSGKQEAPIDMRWDELIKNFITSAGSVGSFIYSLVNIGSPEGLIKFLVQGAECVGEWKGIVSGFSKLKRFGVGYATKIYAKKLFGLNSFAKSLDFSISGANTAAKRFFSNLKRSGAFKKGMTSPVAWITEGIDKGIENYQEFKNGYKDGGTAIAEWATETTLAVGAAAGTVALIGAAVPAAPALVVAAAGGVVVWAVDTAWANTIGRGRDEDGGNEGLIEAAGEGIVEGGKWIAGKAADAAEAIGSGINNGINQMRQYLAHNDRIKTLWAW